MRKVKGQKEADIAQVALSDRYNRVGGEEGRKELKGCPNATTGGVSYLLCTNTVKVVKDCDVT